MKVPTMRELEKAAARLDGIAVNYQDCSDSNTGRIVVIDVSDNTGDDWWDMAEFFYREGNDRSHGHALYLAGQHIEALGRAKEAGL